MNAKRYVRGPMLCILAILAAALSGRSVGAAEGLQWYRGQLHAHSYWSDGRGFPEQAVDAYRERGFDFMCLSEHNRFADDPDHWREVVPEEGTWPPNVTETMFDACLERFGSEWVERKVDGAVTSVRLKTYMEIKEKFEIPGKFLVLPGVEITQTLHSLSVHQNYLNLPIILPIIQGADLIQTLDAPPTVAELLRMNAAQVEDASAELQRPHLLMVNHPFAAYYDIVPQPLMDCPEIRFFEVCNGGVNFPPHPDAATYTIEKLWDTVNAFRRLRGQPFLYGTGSDDAHFYDPERIHGVSGVGDAWVMVRAAALTAGEIFAAMERGDFYATCGVLLDDVTFTAENGTLRVKVQTRPGERYRIHFITTKRDFDQSMTEIDSPAEGTRPARTIPVYSDDIGRIVVTVDGAEGEYRLAPDDLYVRARVESDTPSKVTAHFHPTVQTAWTQPYAMD